MKKEEFITKYGEAAWGKMLQQRRDRYGLHREEEITLLTEEEMKKGGCEI